MMMMRATVKSGTLMILALLVIGLAGCSREQRDWRSAQAADSMEAYDRFLELHPDSSLATQARMRLTQLTEERDWQRASTTDTSDSYRQFLTQHPNGKWSQEARIRVENFSLEDQPFAQHPAEMPRATPGEEAAPLRPAAAASAGDRATPAQPTGIARTDDQSMRARQLVPAIADDAPVPARQATADSMSDEARPAMPARANMGDETRPATPASATERDDGMSARQATMANVSSDDASPATPVSARAAASIDSDFASPTLPGISDQSSYGIQLGAFSSEIKAHEEWRRLEERFNAELGSLRPHVVPAATAAGQLYRLQATVEDEDRARTICASLLQQSQGCVVVLPQR
jgi:SPOR domain